MGSGVKSRRSAFTDLFLFFQLAGILKQNTVTKVVHFIALTLSGQCKVSLVNVFLAEISGSRAH